MPAISSHRDINSAPSFDSKWGKEEYNKLYSVESTQTVADSVTTPTSPKHSGTTCVVAHEKNGGYEAGLSYGTTRRARSVPKDAQARSQEGYLGWSKPWACFSPNGAESLQEGVDEHERNIVDKYLLLTWP